MADKPIGSLERAAEVTTEDLFVLEQSGAAKSLTGLVLLRDLAAQLDGHGGIANIAYTPPAAGSLAGTLTITLADGTVTTATITNGLGIADITYTAPTGTSLTGTVTVTYNDGTSDSFPVTNGRGIASIAWTESGTAGDGMIHTGTITYNDGTTETMEIQDGLKGDTGDMSYVWIKWAEVYPEADEDISDTPGPWLGIYTGTEDTPPTAYTDYVWYQVKGEPGNDGASITGITRISSAGLVDTYAVQLSDGTAYQILVTNGNGITSITGPASSGLTDTYTIHLSDGSTASFTVRNGNGIVSIDLTGSSGLQDTYTVTMSDGSTATIIVTNAKSIVSIEMTSGSHAAGTSDVYTITFNDGSATTFPVYNGTNGSGSVSTVSGIQPVNGDVPQVLSGNGAPTPQTVGQLNQLYYDLSGGTMYFCAGESGGSYNWMGSTVTVDAALSTSSTNPVQNKVITAKVGTVALNTTAQDLSNAVNEVLADIPDKTSDLTNDSGFITAAGAPVQSVVGKTGAVSLAHIMGNVPSSGGTTSYPSDCGRFAVTANIFSNMTPKSYSGVLTIERRDTYQRHVFTSSQGEVYEGWRESWTVAEPSTWTRLLGDDYIVTEEYEVTASIAAGTIGTRGAQVLTNCGKSGYKLLTAWITYVQNSTAYLPVVFRQSGYDSVYCNFYRAQAAAVSASVKFTAVYVKN